MLPVSAFRGVLAAAEFQQLGTMCMGSRDDRLIERKGKSWRQISDRYPAIICY